MVAPDKPADRPHVDKEDGVVRDPVMFGDQVVSYVKDVGAKDIGYDANVKQVQIEMPDGTMRIVPESEIRKNAKPAVPIGTELKRPTEDQLLQRQLADRKAAADAQQQQQTQEEDDSPPAKRTNRRAKTASKRRR